MSAGSRRVALLAALFLYAVAPAGHARAQTDEASFSVSLPVIVDDRRYPGLLVETTVRELRAVSPAALAEAIRPLLSDGAHGELTALGGDLRPVDDIRETGLEVRLNPRTLTIEIEIPAVLRAATAISLAGDWRRDDENAVEPEEFAFGATGALFLSDALSEADTVRGEATLDGFVNFGGAGGVSIDWGAGLALDPDGGVDFRRQRLFGFIDRPDLARRISFGDLDPQLGRNTGLMSLLGVSVERNYQAFQPDRNIRPSGARSLVLERRSTVEVYVNGALIDRIQADAGPFDLRDIPLANTSNDVSIVVEDALGRREVDSFSLSADISLLASGLSEFTWAAGFERRDTTTGFDYAFDRPLAGFWYSRGLSERLTASASGAVAHEFTTAAAGLSGAVSGGVARADIAVSHSDRVGEGVAAGLNFRGGPYRLAGRDAELNVRIDYFGRNFANLNDIASLDDTRWSAGGDLRWDISDRSAVNLGLLYQDDHAGLDRAMTVSAGVNRRFGDIIFTATARRSEYRSRRDETGLFLTLSRRFGGRGLASASHDSQSETSRLEYRMSRSDGLPNFSGRASVTRRENETDLRLTARSDGARYAAQLDAEHRPASGGADERTALALRLQSGIAFAGGRFGIGRDPGRGFVIIDRHASLDEAALQVSLGSSLRAAARSDGFGPAVLRFASPYRAESVRINATGLEPGYNIGPGEYRIAPGALTGAYIIVGDDAFRTAVATIERGAAPVALQFGTLTSVETGETRSFFTNRSGRAAFNALRPGRYRAVFAGGDGRGFEFEIDPGAPAYVELGVIELEDGDD